MASPKKLSNYLRANRKRLGLSQEEVAFLLGSEITTSGGSTNRMEVVDSPSGPNEATLENSIASYYSPGCNGYVPQFSGVMTFYKHGSDPMDLGWFRMDLAQRILSWGGGLDYNFTGAYMGEDPGDPVGDFALSFDDTWGFGYFDHKAASWDGVLPLWQVDETGGHTLFTYDSQKRPVKQTKVGVSATGGFASQSAITNSTSYDASGRTLTNTIAAGSLTLSTVVAYDLQGRVTSQTDTNSLSTTFNYDFGGRKITQTLPTGATKISENFLDRRLKSVTGTGVVHEYHDWNYTSDRTAPLMKLVKTLHTIHFGSSTSNRIRIEGIDWAGRSIRSETLDPNETNSIISYVHYFTSRGKLPSEQYEVLPGGETIVQATGYGYDGTVNTIYIPFVSVVGGAAPCAFDAGRKTGQARRLCRRNQSGECSN
ncbi:MAG: hypothetical protein RLY66_672 [Candidatus Parcubacteria bacterium]|jgi:YD repeat-containing protein